MARKTTAGEKPAAPPARGDERAAAQAREAAKLMEAVARATKERERATFEIARSLARLLEEKLYQPLGHHSFADLARALGMSRSQAFKLAAVGARATAEQLARDGIEASYRASRGRAAAKGKGAKRRK